MQIRFITNADGVKEWIMVEVQGSLQCDGDMSGLLAGNLAWRKSTGQPLLLIGHLMLEGKLVTLDKPLGVLRPGDGETPNEVTAVAIVRRKILFKQRPRPIVSAGNNFVN
uniref:Ctf8 n=1 Tax=Steinernema glaseri TaxID=37863 RepID=A0A1I8A4U9_9BILA